MKEILILSNHHVYTYNFRKEIIQELIDNNYKVYIALPYGEKVELLKEMGCHFIDIPLNRRGKNPIEELNLVRKIYKIIRDIKPDVVLSYTIKPNIYGGLICKKLEIPFIPNVTGLGTAVSNKTILQELLLKIYKISFSDAHTVFLQNELNRKIFEDNKIALNQHELLPGSGVQLSDFPLMPYPSTEESIEFVFISRIMKDKGIDEYLEAAEYIREKYPNIKFHICGFLDGDYKEILNEYQKKGIIDYHGMVDDISQVFKYTHCTINPSYHEGMSNVLLESAASGRPVLASDIPGCKETYDEGTSGFSFEPANTQSLIRAIENFISLSYEQKKTMGLAGRRKMEKEFDRRIVVKKYLEEIESI